MCRAIGEIDHFFGMSDGPIPALFLVARVGAGGGVPESESFRHIKRPALDGTSEEAVSGAHELSVPVLGGQPELHFDQGIGSGPEVQFNPAMGRDIRLRRPSPEHSGFWGRAFSDERSTGDRGVGKLKIDQFIARCRGNGGAQKEESNTIKHSDLLAKRKETVSILQNVLSHYFK
jgi:hypothetical protein